MIVGTVVVMWSRHDVVLDSLSSLERFLFRCINKEGV